MDPVTSEITIGLPREEVFEYLADIANHAEFTDHYLVDWRLTREDSYGQGAGARFRVKAPLNRFPFADATLAVVEPPHRIVERGRAGKFNRNQTLGTYELDALSPRSTRVRFTMETNPAKPSDRFMESLGARRWFKRKNDKALKRLRSILEAGHGRGQRATVAGGPRKPASGYRYRATANR